MENYYKYISKSKSKFINAPGAWLTHPYRLLIIGSSGSGKTNALTGIFFNNPVFDQVYIFAKTLDSDPLYTDLLIPALEEVGKKVKKDILKIATNDISELPDIDSFEQPKAQKLMIFDDFIFDKDVLINEYFTRARKKNMSLVYITQNITNTPMDIRRNVDSVAATRITMQRDYDLVANQFLIEKKEFKFLYNLSEKVIILTQVDGKRKLVIDGFDFPFEATEFPEKLANDLKIRKIMKMREDVFQNKKSKSKKVKNKNNV